MLTLYHSLFPSALVSSNTRMVLALKFTENCMTGVMQIEYI